MLPLSVLADLEVGWMSEATSTSPARDDADDGSHLAGVRNAAAEHGPKHRRLIRSARGGRVLSALMLPGVLVWPGSAYGVITTTGRKTGRARRKCIRAIRRGNRAYIVNLRPPEVAMTRPSAVAAWVWNIRSNPNVTLRIRGGTFAGVARELTDPVELAEARGCFAMRSACSTTASAPFICAGSRPARRSRAASLLVRHRDTARSRPGGLAAGQDGQASSQCRVLVSQFVTAESGSLGRRSRSTLSALPGVVPPSQSIELSERRSRTKT